MAIIERLKVDGFRNLADVDLMPSSGFNLVTGVNGSGKTSFLEAIHVLSVGKSFRTQRIDSLVNVDKNDFVIYGDFQPGDLSAGLQKSRQGKTTLRFQGQTQRNWQELASALPLQVINSDSFALLEAGARYRRRFMDWAVFHVEHDYLQAWRGYQRCLAQRNALLKSFSGGSRAHSISELDPWERELARCGEIVHHKRMSLLTAFEPLLSVLVDELMPYKSLSLTYKPGWDDTLAGGIQESLDNTRARDIRYGATQHGPHRADFVLSEGGRNVVEIFSRGQLKMLVCALKLAMGDLVLSRYEEANKRYGCIYLVDDLASELDAHNRELVTQLLAETGAQCFFTAISPDDLVKVRDAVSEHSGKFHVEHGKILAVQ